AGGESKFDNNMNKRTGRLKPGLTVAYEGTNAGSGYGGIYNSYEYVNSKYNNGYKSKDWGTLDKDMPKFLMNTFEKNVNNCTLTAITR
ncbi:MAG: hypothetical protein RR145_02175, partial [Oscillospiraceae bacterium]